MYNPIHDVYQIMGFSWVLLKFPNNFWDQINQISNKKASFSTF